MKAVWNGVVVAESDDTVVVEGNHYFPESSLKREYTTFSNHRSSCPWKGQAHYYSLLVNGESNPDAVWFYPEPSQSRRADQGPCRLLERCEGGVGAELGVQEQVERKRRSASFEAGSCARSSSAK